MNNIYIYWKYQYHKHFFLYQYLEKSKWSTIIKVYMSTWIHHTNQNDPKCNMNLDNHKNNNMCLVAWRKQKTSTISIVASMDTIIIILSHHHIHNHFHLIHLFHYHQYLSLVQRWQHNQHICIIIFFFLRNLYFKFVNIAIKWI